MPNTINLPKEVITILRVKYDVTRSTFKYVESLWFRHHKMVKRLKELEERVPVSTTSLTDMNAGIRAVGRISKPVEAAVIGDDRDSDRRQLEELTRIIHAMETVYNMLPEEYKRLVHARYYATEKRNWEQIAHHANYSAKHGQRIRDAIVVATAELLGLW